VDFQRWLFENLMLRREGGKKRRSKLIQPSGNQVVKRKRGKRLPHRRRETIPQKNRGRRHRANVETAQKEGSNPDTSRGVFVQFCKREKGRSHFDDPLQ